MGARRTRLALLLAGLRFRAGSSAAMFAVAVFGVAMAAFGPLYLHGAGQAILDETLQSAPPGDTGLTLVPASGAGSSSSLLQQASSAPRRSDGRPWFGTAIATEDVGLSLVSNGQLYGASLVARTGVCSRLSITGRCPRATGEAVLSVRTARQLGVDLGQTLVVSVATATSTTDLRVTGLYVPGRVDDPFWWGVNFFPFGSGPPTRPLVDALFVAPATIAASTPSSSISRLVQLPYNFGSLGVDDTGTLQDSLQGYQRNALQHGIRVTTRLVPLFAQATSSRHTTSGIVAVVDVQLVLLSLFVLYFVSDRTAVEREPDIRLAAIRGFRPRSTLAVAMAEPLAIICAAMPIGLLVAWLVGLASADELFGAGIGVTVTPLAVGAAVATGLVGLGASALGIRSTLAGTGAAAGFDTVAPGARPSRWSVAGDVVIVAVAVAAFVELVLAGVSEGGGSGRTDPLAALAPGSLALAVGILGARLLPVALRSTFGSSAGSPKVAWALATRRVARRREFASHVMLLTVAVGLATFAACGWAIAGRNRDVRTGFDVGASRVLTVAVRPGVDFLRAVESADPSGRSAMAAVVENASDGSTLAVDSRRMAGVISWPPGLGAADVTKVAKQLVPAGLAPPVIVAGTELRVTVESNVDAQPPPEISAVLFDKGFQTSSNVVLGTLVPGAGTYQASIAGLCPAGCRLAALALTWAPPSSTEAPPTSVELTISALSELSASGGWQPVRAGLDVVKRWSIPSGGGRLGASPSGLEARVDLNPFGVPTDIAPADTPAQLPAIVSASVSASNAMSPGALAIVGLDGGTVEARQAGVVPALPRLGDGAVMVDLGMAERLQSGPFAYATPEVWLSSTASPGMESRLARAGINVTSVDSTAERLRASRHSGVSLAYSFFLMAAVAAGVLAVGASAFAVAAGAGRRRGELAALHAIGVQGGTLRRFLEAELALVVATGLAVGTAAGLTAAAVALRTVPEFSSVEPGPPLQLGLPGLVTGALLVALVLALAATAILGARIVVRGTSAEELAGVRT